MYFCFKKKNYEINKEKSETTTLVDGTLDDVSRQFYPGISIYVAFVTLITYPVSTCPAKGSFSGMKGVKNPCSKHYEWATLAMLHIHKHKNRDIDKVVSEFPS